RPPVAFAARIDETLDRYFCRKRTILHSPNHSHRHTNRRFIEGVELPAAVRQEQRPHKRSIVLNWAVEVRGTLKARHDRVDSRHIHRFPLPLSHGERPLQHSPSEAGRQQPFRKKRYLKEWYPRNSKRLPILIGECRSHQSLRVRAIHHNQSANERAVTMREQPAKRAAPVMR